MEDSYA